MGFLDQSTNNIIVDAVLTDVGREFLARNDGSFSISKFAFGDDEVDYTIIKKYGRTVGKEKIIKNTPVTEALTNGDISLRFKNLSLSTPTLIRLPNLKLVTAFPTTVSTDDISLTNLNLNIVDTREGTITIKQDIGAGEIVPPELIDGAFRVEVNNLFLLPTGGARPISIDTNNIATYIMTAADALDPTSRGALFSLTLGVKSSLTTTLFDTYGTAADKTLIRTYVQITGQQSGTQANLLVLINKTA